jgi:hypothetical protein
MDVQERMQRRVLKPNNCLEWKSRFGFGGIIWQRFHLMLATHLNPIQHIPSCLFPEYSSLERSFLIEHFPQRISFGYRERARERQGVRFNVLNLINHDALDDEMGPRVANMFSNTYIAFSIFYIKSLSMFEMFSLVLQSL